MHNIDITKYRNQIIEEICNIVRIRSVKEAPLPGKPFGDGAWKALMYALDLGKRLGVDTCDVDGYAGHVEIGEGEGYIGVLNHLDVVPEGEGWSVPPYGGTLKDGRIYGRGSSDNKGPAIVSMFCLKALKDAGLPLKRRVRLILGTDEESTWKCMEHYFNAEPLPDYGFSPDAGYPIYNREKGILVLRFFAKGSLGDGIETFCGGVARNSVPDHAEAKITSTFDAEGMKDITYDSESRNIVASGIPAHGANPQAGKNAIITLLTAVSSRLPEKGLGKFLLNCIGRETAGESLGVNCIDEPSGALSLNLGIVRPCNDGYEAFADIRFPVTRQMETIRDTAAKVAAGYGVEMSVEKYTAPLYVPADAPMLKELANAYEETTGLKSELLSMGGGTYARVLQNRGVAFGPGFPGSISTNGHQADEFIVVDDLMRHAKTCLQAIINLANMQ